MIQKLTTSAIVAALLTACAAGENPSASARLTVRLDSLTSIVDSLRWKTIMQGIEIDGLKDAHQRVIIDPVADKGYQRLDSDLGSFALLVDNIAEYGDGTRVRLTIGNLSSATYSGGKFSVTWGEREPTSTGGADTAFYSRYSKWRDGLNKRDIEFTEKLYPATWNKVSVVLPGTAPSRFGYLEVSLKTNTLSMRTQ